MMDIIPKNTVTLGCDTGPFKCALAKGIWHFSIHSVKKNLMFKC